MYKTLSYILITIISFTLLSNVAFAKRFGGGRSFGQQRSYSAPHKTSSTKAKSPNKASKWLGPLAGLAIGGMLASLFMGHGFGTGILSWLLLAAAIFVIFRVINHLKSQNKMSYEGSNGRTLSDFSYKTSANNDYADSNYATSSNTDSNYTDNKTSFNKDDFLRQAKTVFIRMQTAYDNKNLTDIREFTTPEVFAEIQIQIQERGNDVNITEVLHIEAELAEKIYDSSQNSASVIFKGSIREQPDAEPKDINEIWYIEKDTYSNTWKVAGLKQL